MPLKLTNCHHPPISVITAPKWRRTTRFYPTSPSTPREALHSGMPSLPLQVPHPHSAKLPCPPISAVTALKWHQTTRSLSNVALDTLQSPPLQNAKPSFPYKHLPRFLPSPPQNDPELHCLYPTSPSTPHKVLHSRTPSLHLQTPYPHAAKTHKLPLSPHFCYHRPEMMLKHSFLIQCRSPYKRLSFTPLKLTGQPPPETPQSLPQSAVFSCPLSLTFSNWCIVHTCLENVPCT